MERPLAVIWCFALCASPAWGQPATVAPPDQPVTYEVQINGESFMIEANRLVKLSSTRTPGVKYDIAVRMAPTQQCVLNHFEFQYDCHATLDDDRGRELRTVNLRHQLGFSFLVTDLGTATPQTDLDQLLATCVESTAKTFRELGMTNLQIGQPQDRQEAVVTTRGVVLHYRDKRQFEHTCLVFVFHQKNYWATGVIQYFDRDSQDCLPLIKRMLDSLRLR
jgi:hypothetical protein